MIKLVFDILNHVHELRFWLLGLVLFASGALALARLLVPLGLDVDEEVIELLVGNPLKKQVALPSEFQEVSEIHGLIVIGGDLVDLLRLVLILFFLLTLFSCSFRRISLLLLNRR